MWPFSHKAKHSADIPEEIHDRLKALESDFRLVRMEWGEVYDKIVHALDRERKRKAKIIEEIGGSTGKGDGEIVPQGPTSEGFQWQDPVFILTEARKRGL